MSTPPELDMMPLTDFINLVRDRPDLFPREELARRAQVSPITIYRVLRRNPRTKFHQDPKLSTLRALLAGCGGEILVGFRSYPRRQLTRDKG